MYIHVSNVTIADMCLIDTMKESWQKYIFPNTEPILKSIYREWIECHD